MPELTDKYEGEGFTLAERYAIAFAFAAGDPDATRDVWQSVLNDDPDRVGELMAAVIDVLAGMVGAALGRDTVRKLVAAAS